MTTTGTLDQNAHLSISFQKTLTVLAGRRRSPLLDAITIKPFVGGGKEDYSDGFDSIDREANEVLERYGDSPHREILAYRRKIILKQYDDGKLLDRVDLGKFKPHDPTDATTVSLDASVHKKIERAIIEAMWGTAFGGENGTDAYTFDANMIVAVNSHKYGSGSGNVGMTVSKFLEAREKLIDGNDESDEAMASDPIYAGLTQAEISQMLTYEETTNSQYVGELMALKTGKIDEFAGVKVVRLSKKRMSTQSSGTIRQVPIWFKSGIEARMGDMEAWVRPRNDKKGIPYAYVNRFFGVARVDEQKIADVRCLI